MIGTLYRYQHPNDPTKFLYVGQGPSRDSRHRSGESSFGRRFKELFPTDVLPQPIKERVEVSNQLELNEEEIIWMFRFRTWRGYVGGMNLALPGFRDYVIDAMLDGFSRGGKTSGRIATESGRIQALGRVQARKNIESGFIQNLGRIYGKINVENGHLASIRTPEGMSKGAHRRNEIYGNPATPEGCVKGGQAGGRKHIESGHIQALGKIQGYITCCLRWNIRRGKPCTCGKHL